MDNPVLQFDFSADGNTPNPILFSQPEEVFIAYTLPEISSCLKNVEQAIADGYYVAGYLSYEATYAFYDGITENITNKMPLLWFGVFREFSHQAIDEVGMYSVSDWEALESKTAYAKKFNQIMKAIERMEIEQLNYTVPFQAAFTGNAFAYYNELKNAQQSKYSAYIDIGKFQILSASPELFFNVKDDVIKVKPMKGTIHRGKTFEEDMENKQWLQTSAKNKRENKLITDLMIEELKKVTEKASIELTRKYDIETYPTVFQMTSTITGTISSGVNITDIIKSLFPCGSISGVPKVETMKMIANVESNPREVYCGAIGYITPNKEAVFNVPIRTVMIDKMESVAKYAAGGAITIDSTLEEEYEEMMTKTKVLHWKHQSFQLLETFGLFDGKYLVFDEHLQRLKRSATYFNYNINIVKIKHKLLEYANEYRNNSWRVRLLLDIDGKEHIEIHKLQDIKTNKVKLAKYPITRNNHFLYHKTTNRELYGKLMRKNVFDTLLWNEEGEVTEFTIGNIVIDLDGELITPPVKSGLLPGTYREKLVREGKIKEKVIYKSDVMNCSRIWLINSVRKWVKVDLQST